MKIQIGLLIITTLLLQSCCTWASKNCSTCKPTIVTQVDKITITPSILPGETISKYKKLSSELSLNSKKQVKDIHLLFQQMKDEILYLRKRVFEYEKRIHKLKEEIKPEPNTPPEGE